MIKFFDGAMGSMLRLKAGELPELLNINEPERVLKIHFAYADAGADYITANTFGANSLKYNNVAELVRAGVELAGRAGKKVALDIGPTGKLLKPMGDLDFERAVELFAEVVNAGKDGSDIAIIETMSDSYELKAAVLAVKENSDLPII
ncbi:MAG: homocysteine S-methyltransferase family protein, partial [Eubacterium sp.]|nr:homocysteine S-methyltransferase family protein [Eubacterium sp.]